MLLTRENQLRVTAIDLSADNLLCARDRAAEAGLAEHPIRYIQADAANLPLESGRLDGVLAECTFSLFADKSAVLAEIHRVLKPGAALAITDMATGGELAEDLASTIAPWTCLLDTRDRSGYLKLFEAADFELEEFANESASLHTLLSALKRKLLLIGAGALLGQTTHPDFDLGSIRYWLDRIQEEVQTGAIQYQRFNLRSMN